MPPPPPPLLLLLLALALPVRTGGARWRQDRFAVSVWVDPVVHPDAFDARYAQMRAANFTVLLGGFGATTPDAVGQQLDACERAGLRAIVSTCGGGGGGGGGGDGPSPGACVAPSAGHPALWGYQMKDEPSADEFPALRAWSDAVAAAAPATLRFINLLPNYATAAQLNASDYGAYVDAFAETVDPDILCMDAYPFFELTDMTRNVSTDGYHRNLAVLRDAALRLRRPFWNFFNAMPFASHLAPTEGQIAWQAFTSLAYGAKGVLYFTYWSPGFPPPPPPGQVSTRSGAFSKGGGLISPVSYGIDGDLVFEPTLQYEFARRVNSVLLNFGAYLLNATSLAVWRPDRGAPPPAVCPILNMAESNGAPNGTYLIGIFSVPAAAAAAGVGAGEEEGEAHTGVLVQNQRFDIEVWPTVALRDGVASRLREIDPSTGSLRPVRDDSPGMPGLQMARGPGRARLLVVVSDGIDTVYRS